MGRPSEAILSGPQLPGAIVRALHDAAQAQAGGQLDRAVVALSDALTEVRTEPFGTPFAARVQLVLTLSDVLLEAGDRARARELLIAESAYCEQITQLLAINGTLEQRRAASAGRMQVRDRAAQVELLDQPAPELSVEDWVLGDGASLAEVRGRVVLLEFWATWCRPCLEMFPRLSELHERYAERGLEILALTRYGPTPPDADAGVARARERELVQTVVADRGLQIRVGIAPDGRMQTRYGANGVPTLVLIGRDGRVRLFASGGDDASVEAAIRACLDEQEIRDS